MNNERSAFKKDDPRERYLYDAEFRTLVDTMLKLVESCQFTPFELRQALVLALILYEERRLVPHPFKMPVDKVSIKWADEE